MKRKQQCSGYDDRKSCDEATQFVLYDYTTTETKKKDRPPKEDQPDDTQRNFNGRCSDFVLFPPSPGKLDGDDCDALQLFQPTRSLETEALCYFFTNYVCVPRDPSTNNFIEHIMPPYLSALPGSAVWEAVSSVALSVTSVWMTKLRDSQLPRQTYNKAVAQLKILIDDPYQYNSDEALTTIFLLDFQDSFDLRFDHRIEGGIHQQGAIAILTSRGHDNFKSAHTQRLFNAVRSRHIDHVLRTGGTAQLDSTLSRKDTAIMPSAKLDLLKLQLVKLHEIISRGMKLRNLQLGELCRLVLREAQSLEGDFQQWRTDLPPSWQPMRLAVSDLHPSILHAGVYRDMCEVYSSLTVSQVNNEGRSAHVTVLSVMAWCLKALKDLGIPVSREVEMEMTIRFQSIVDSFCASIPFHLGNRADFTFPYEHREYPQIPAQLRNLAKYVDALGSDTGMTDADHMRAAATGGSLFFMSLIVGSLQSPIPSLHEVGSALLVAQLPPDQLQWIKVQADRARRVYASLYSTQDQ